MTDAVTGIPIAGATVSYPPGTGSATTTTASNGTYTLANVTEGSYQVTASAANYTAQTVTVVVGPGGSATKNFPLAPNPGSISGTVTDLGTGLPIAGATVSYPPGSGSATTTTASDGTYTLANVTEGGYQVTASAAGYTSKTVTVPVAPGATSTQNFALTPGAGTISGTVTDAVTGIPIAGATVSYPPGTGSATTTSAGDGTYTLANVTEGSYQVTASAANYTAQTVTVVVGPGGSATKNFPLAPNPGSISGTVTDLGTGLPIAGATVSYPPGSGSATTTTASDGTYTLANVTEGSYQVTASAAGYASKTFTVPVAPGATSTQNFALAPDPGTISGTVTDAVTGLPIAGATVSYPPGSGSATTTTASDGTYTLANVAPGTYTVTASDTGYVTQSPTNVLVSSGATTTQNFALAPNPGTISGTVTDAVTGIPIAGATVSYPPGTGSATTTTASNGTYTLANVTEGSYQVTASAANYTAQTVTVVVGPGGSATKNFPLAPNPGSISGTVTDLGTGLPIAGATVSYPPGSGSATTTTASDGTYTLANVTEGSYQVTASAAGYTSKTVTVPVAPGATSTQNFALATTHQPVFSDGFELGALSGWTSTIGLSIESTNVHTGTYAAKGKPSNASANAQKLLPSTYNSGYERVWFNIVSQTSQVNILRARTAAGASLAYVLVNSPTATASKDDLCINILSVKTCSTTSVLPGSGWHEVEMYTAVNGATPSVQVWLDGTLISTLTSTTNLGATPIGELQIGEGAPETWDVAFDDAAFDTQFLP